MSLRATTSIASARPHHRQVTDSTVSPRTSVSSTVVLAGEVEVPELGGAPGAPDVEPGQVAAAAAPPPAGCVGQRRRPAPVQDGALGDLRRGLPGNVGDRTYRRHHEHHVDETARWESQRSFDELGRPLRDITFTVVDLETTGGSAEAGSMITEIGAVKVRGGEVLGEFQTLVNPHTEIPPFIAVLTGISNAMVGDAPPDRLGAAGVPRVRAGHRAGRPQRAVRRRLPPALQRAAGPGLADVRGRRHRQAGAPGDHPRRRAQLQALLAGPGLPLDDDAQPPGAVRRPGHRRRAARADGAARQPRRAHPRGAADVLVAGLDRPAPQAPPGRGPAARARASTSSATTRGRVLYVGTSRDLRTRVRTYFTASETRSRMGEMVGLATSVTGIVCAPRSRRRSASCG